MGESGVVGGAVRGLDLNSFLSWSVEGAGGLRLANRTRAGHRPCWQVIQAAFLRHVRARDGGIEVLLASAQHGA